MRPLLVLLFTASLAHAGGTRSFKITSYKEFEEGEATGVLLSSLGEAQSGFSANRVALDESAAWAMAAAPDGSVYIGTGDQGVIRVYKGGKTRELTKLDAVLVSSLAVSASGTIYAGTMPGGKIFTVSADGKSKELCKLDAEHVWALSLDEAKGTLYAGTGPNGKVFAIDVKSGKSRVHAETGEKHVLSLLRLDDGALAAGSGDQAILFRIAPDGKVAAIHDFEGEEVKAIARKGATLFVAVNEFQKSSLSTSSSSSGPLAPKGTKMVVPPAIGSTPPAPPGRDRKGKGAVYRVDADGRVEQMHALADAYFTALYAENDGSVYAASGGSGRVYLLRPDRTVVTAFDVPERQVLSLSFDKGDRLLGTGDAGAIYKVTSEPHKDANYTSKVFDAHFPAKWGTLRFRGSGALTFQTRSGNTAKPDRTWSSWQAPARTDKLPDGGTGKVASPEGRYLQVKVGFGPKTTLRDLTVFNQPQNQRPRVTEIIIGEDGTPKKVSPAARKTPRSPIIKLRWKAENPDDDELTYRLYYREETEVNWKPLGGPDALTRTDYDWNTEPIPDGNYLLKVVASDERSNPKELALDHALLSVPFLVDNKKPELVDVKVDYPYASGRARDGFSPLSELAWSLDGGDWQPLAPRDGVLDDPNEDWSLKLPANLSSGGHSLALRAIDAADNLGAIQLPFKVK